MKNLLKHTDAFFWVHLVILVPLSFHTAWGFGILDGLPPVGAVWWWVKAFMLSACVDVFIAVLSLQYRSGKGGKYLLPAIVVAVVYVLYANIKYAAAHASPVQAVTQTSLQPVMQWVLNYRVLIDPVLLSAAVLFLSVYGKKQVVPAPLTGVVHLTGTHDRTRCGYPATTTVNTTDIPEQVNCKKCVTILKNTSV